jgi:hypothetical protein
VRVRVLPRTSRARVQFPAATQPKTFFVRVRVLARTSQARVQFRAADRPMKKSVAGSIPYDDFPKIFLSGSKFEKVGHGFKSRHQHCLSTVSGSKFQIAGHGFKSCHQQFLSIVTLT